MPRAYCAGLGCQHARGVADLPISISAGYLFFIY